MSDARPLASLTPTLLARKGGAKPVLRSQIRDSAALDEGLAVEADLSTPAESAEVVTLKPGAGRKDSATSGMRDQLDLLESRLSEALLDRAPTLREGRTAAFTLRLDAERHLRLRLACALANRSAQSLVTDALDHMLASLPEVADLAARVSKRG